MAALLTDPAGDPTAVTRVITEATDPVMEEERGDGGVVLRAQLPPTPELAKLGDIPTVDVFLHLDADRQPVEARFTAEAGAASAEVTVTFSDWGGSIAVEPPADADVDHTPWISEEGLAVLDPKLLLAPTSLPEPLEIVSASVFDTAFDQGLTEGEAAPCPQLSLTMGSKAEVLLSSDEADMTEEELDEYYSSMTFLDLSIVDPACSEMYDSGYFDGELAGFPASGDQGMWEVAIGDVVVSIYSEGYDEEEVAAVIASMQPTTVDALAAAIPGWVADGMEGAFGGGFALGGWSGMGFAFG